MNRNESGTLQRPTGKFPAPGVFFLSLAAIIATGAILTVVSVVQTDRVMRTNLLLQAQLTTHMLDIGRIEAFTGTDADTGNPRYARMKQELEIIRATNPTYRFIYILGRKTDGSVYFILDSEAITSPDYVKPGQPYPDVPPEYLRVFASGTASVEGPVTDRWGSWVSALVPLPNAVTGMTEILFGIDIDAGAWNRDLASSTLPALLFTLSLMGLSFLFLVINPSRNRLPLLISAAGIALTIFIALSIGVSEARNRDDTFFHQAISKTELVAEALKDITESDLESLARFHSASTGISPREYRQFTEYLTAKPTVTAWEWIPVVSAAEKNTFEREARQSGLENFEIWQKDDTGSRIPVSGRQYYYPVYRIAPYKGNETALGYDLGSEALRLFALEEAKNTGLTSGTEAVALVQDKGNRKGMLIFRPVYSNAENPQLTGFCLAVLRLEALINQTSTDTDMFLSLSLLRPEGGRELLAESTLSNDTPKNGLVLERPVAVFGKVFFVTANAGPGFLRQHALTAGWTAFFVGFILTAMIHLLLSQIMRQREKLEREIEKRTEELALSEQNFRTFFETMNDMIFIADREGRIFYTNGIVRLKLGYSPIRRIKERKPNRFSRIS